MELLHWVEFSWGTGKLNFTVLISCITNIYSIYSCIYKILWAQCTTFLFTCANRMFSARVWGRAAQKVGRFITGAFYSITCAVYEIWESRGGWFCANFPPPLKTRCKDSLLTDLVKWALKLGTLSALIHTSKGTVLTLMLNYLTWQSSTIVFSCRVTAGVFEPVVIESH